MDVSRIPLEVYHEILVPRSNDLDLNTSFPHGGATQELTSLSNSNLVAARKFHELLRAGFDYTRQLPPTIGISCSRIDFPTATQGQIPGSHFGQAVRGGISPAILESINYGLLLPSKSRVQSEGAVNPAIDRRFPEKFIGVVVHSYGEGDQELKGEEFSALDDSLLTYGEPLVELGDLKSVMQQNGIAVSDLTNDEGADVIHAHGLAQILLSKIPDLRGGIAEGSVLLGEGIYQRDSGQINWIRFWHSASLHAYEGVLSAIVDGVYVDKKHLNGYPLHIQTLNSLVHGNRNFINRYSFNDQFITPSKAEAVILSCADSRVSHLFETPVGSIEFIRIAGNVVDDVVLRSFRIACEEAVHNAESRALPLPGLPKNHKQKAVAIFLGHTQCGAVGHTLETIAAGDSECLHDAKFGHLTRPIAERLRYYTQEHPDHERSDVSLSAAAEANAAGSLIDALFKPNNSDSVVLRQLVLDGKLDLVVAKHSIETHVMQMNPPIGANELKKLMQYFSEE